MIRKTIPGIHHDLRRAFPGIYNFWRLNCNLTRKAVLILCAGFLLFSIWPASAAEFSLPRMEMATRGWVDDGDFVLSSIISADLALTGGYKYAFILGFSLEAPNIGKAFADRNIGFEIPPSDPVLGEDYNELVDQINDRLNNQAYLGFRIAKATIRDVFGLPLEMSYFIGAGDDFCSGDEYSSRFGLLPFGTEYKGFFYFPEGIGGHPGRRYNGIHSIRGTGFSLSLSKWEKIIPSFYLYQDFPNSSDIISFKTAFGGNLYSADLRVLFYHDWLRLEAFGGLSLNTNLDVSIRGGLMTHFSGHGVEFFAQIGIPGWTAGEKFSIDNMYFLIEPRLHQGIFHMYLTFFYHPVEYIHVITPDEKGKANINIKFLFGNLDSGLSGGIETGGELKFDGSKNFKFDISPTATLISGGLRWDAKFRIKPLEYDNPKEMFDIFIGVRTAF